MDMKTLYQAQLFAPAFMFQSFLESWAGLFDPRVDANSREPLSRARSPRIEVAPAVLDPAVVVAQTIAADERALEPA